MDGSDAFHPIHPGLSHHDRKRLWSLLLIRQRSSFLKVATLWIPPCPDGYNTWPAPPAPCTPGPCRSCARRAAGGADLSGHVQGRCPAASQATRHIIWPCCGRRNWLMVVPVCCRCGMLFLPRMRIPTRAGMAGSGLALRGPPKRGRCGCPLLAPLHSSFVDLPTHSTTEQKAEAVCPCMLSIHGMASQAWSKKWPGPEHIFFGYETTTLVACAAPTCCLMSWYTDSRGADPLLDAGMMPSGNCSSANLRQDWILDAAMEGS